MNKHLDELIERAIRTRKENVTCCVETLPGDEKALDEFVENIMKAAYEAGARAALEATRIDTMVGCEDTKPDNQDAEACGRCTYALAHNSALEQQQALSDQFLATLTDTQ